MISTELKRPSSIERTEGMNLQLATAMAELIVKWSKNHYTFDDCFEMSFKFFTEEIRVGNGYDIAKTIEEYNWLPISPDLELIEYLDYIGVAEMYDAERNAVQKWVKDNELVLTFKVGEIIEFKNHLGNKRGEIVELHPEIYSYGVWNEELGYEKNKGHVIIHAEKLI